MCPLFVYDCHPALTWLKFALIVCWGVFWLVALLRAKGPNPLWIPIQKGRPTAFWIVMGLHGIGAIFIAILGARAHLKVLDDVAHGRVVVIEGPALHTAYERKNGRARLRFVLGDISFNLPPDITADTCSANRGFELREADVLRLSYVGPADRPEVTRIDGPCPK